MIEKGEYKGYPTITLKKTAEDEWGWSFGPAKARLFIQHLPEIQAWLKELDDDQPTAIGTIHHRSEVDE